MKVTQTKKRKPIAEGVMNVGVGRYLQGEPTVTATVREFDPQRGYIHTGAEFTISELRRLLKGAEETAIVKEWDREQARKDVRIIDAGYTLLDTYRGFEIGSHGLGKVAVYKNGETFSDRFLFSVPDAQSQIDYIIRSSFDQWLIRFTEVATERGLAVDGVERHDLGRYYSSSQTPEEAALMECDRVNS